MSDASAIERDNVVLDQGKIDCALDDLFIDCTAKAFSRRSPVPVFDGDRITLQLVRAGRVSLSAAVIAHVEASYDDDAVRNDLCSPIPTPDVTADWPRDVLADLRVAQRWSSDKALRQWITEHRLTGAGFATTGEGRSPEAARAAARLKDARPKAEANLARLVAALDSRG